MNNLKKTMLVAALTLTASTQAHADDQVKKSAAEITAEYYMNVGKVMGTCLAHSVTSTADLAARAYSAGSVLISPAGQQVKELRKANQQINDINEGLFDLKHAKEVNSDLCGSSIDQAITSGTELGRRINDAASAAGSYVVETAKGLK